MAGIFNLADSAPCFLRDRRGNFAIAFAVVVSALALSAGYALNMVQLVTVRSNLLNALDSAVTSTARDLTTGKILPENARDRVLAFLEVNGGTGFALADTIQLRDLVVDRTAKTVSAKASVDIDLAFPLFSLASRQTVLAESAALYSDKKVEVAMMLDVTGSMAGDKIEDLKDAAKAAVEAFLKDENPANPRVRMAIVPYADAVNTGPLAHTVFAERGGSTGADDVPPALDDHRSVSTPPDRCATERKLANGNPDFSDASPYTAMVNRDDRLAFCPAARLLPLTSDMRRLNRTIDDFAASGYTAGHIGVQWTRYLLSPSWAGVIEAASAGSAPARFDRAKLRKIAILMTDGEFNTAYAGVPRREATRGAQGGRSRNAAEEHCRQMRRDGIEIFTIGFKLRESAAKAVMKNCATPDTDTVRHYYEVSDGEALEAAFREIASNVEKLALTR